MNYNTYNTEPAPALQKEKPTLIQALERLNHKCAQLGEVTKLTEKLNDKLNRTEGQPKCEEDLTEKEYYNERNIVELFYLIADNMEVQIDVILNNIEYTMSMID